MVRVEYEKIKAQVLKALQKGELVIFNSGEMADSLSMEHITGAAQEFIPWFGGLENGYLFMLTKSDNVDGILNLNHNGHTILAWSMNEPGVSRQFEIGAPSFERRLEAARKAQQAGYRLRLRLDPIVPVDGWREVYAGTIARIFEMVSPERITLGTLRFEEGFIRNRHELISTGSALPGMMSSMEAMFEAR
jgi:spore photoproduct lyase